MYMVFVLLRDRHGAQATVLNAALKPIFGRRFKAVRGGYKDHRLLFRQLVGSDSDKYVVYEKMPRGEVYDVTPVVFYIAEKFSDADAVAMRIALSDYARKIVAFEFAGDVHDFYTYAMAARFASSPPAKVRDGLVEQFFEHVGKRTA